jgi:hypothetical protein
VFLDDDAGALRLAKRLLDGYGYGGYGYGGYGYWGYAYAGYAY